MGFQGNYQGKFQGNFDGSLGNPPILEDVSSSLDLTSSDVESVVFVESDSSSLDLTSSSTSISVLVELLTSAFDATSGLGEVDPCGNDLDVTSTAVETVVFIESNGDSLNVTSATTESVDFRESVSDSFALTEGHVDALINNPSSSLDMSSSGTDAITFSEPAQDALGLLEAYFSTHDRHGIDPEADSRFISMTCPFEGGAGSRDIQLRRPDLYDHDKFETPVAFKMAMSGRLYGRRTSPRPEVLVWTFSNLHRIKARELEDFIEFAAGRNIRLLDSDLVSWKVKLALQAFSFTTHSRGIGSNIPEFASVTIELEGNKL